MTGNPKLPLALKDLIRRNENRNAKLLAHDADLKDAFAKAIKDGDIDSADPLAVQLEHQREALALTVLMLKRLFKLAMDKTMERVRQDDRDT